ncbi:MAG: flagellar export protein FliJ [Tepidanaerobacteraceae bacterium]|jgi:flagellar FliJ protein|nr:flagellar export protein FliJ [Tepidanaerobacteraceae bacterium]
MKKFYFKLEAPLKVKKINEDLCKQKLAEAITLKLKEENRLNFLMSTEAKARDDLKDKLWNSARVEDLCRFITYICDLNSNIQLQISAVNNAAREYDRCRFNYIETRKERQVIEKVKEKQFAAHLKEINSEEQKISDESGIAREMFRKGETP